MSVMTFISGEMRRRVKDEFRATRRVSRLFCLVFLLGASVLVQTREVHAQNVCQTTPLPPECVSFEFQAIVNSIVDPDAVLGTLALSESFVGVMTINTAVADTDPGPDDGVYPDAIECAQVDLADRTLFLNLDPSLPIDERRMEVVNDLPDSSSGFTIISDAVAAATGGSATMDIAGLPPAQDILGAAALSYGYTKSCIQPIQTPCPPILLVDDSIPGAPGDVTTLDTSPLTFRFADLAGTGNLALVQATMTRLDPAVPIPCPEPAMGIAWPAVATWLVIAARFGGD